MITLNEKSKNILFQVFNRLRLFEQATLILKGKPYLKIRYASFTRFNEEMPTDKYTIEHTVQDGGAPMIINIMVIRFRKNDDYPEAIAEILPIDFSYKTIFQVSVHGHFRNEITINLQNIDDHVRSLNEWLNEIEVLEMHISLAMPNYKAEN